MAEQATHGFTRRSFIKGAAALTAAGALVGCSPQTQNLEKAEPQKDIPETQIFSGVCRGNCAGGCFLNVHVRDGQVVRTSMREMPDPQYNRICMKGLSHPYRIYSDERLKYPLRRAGERGSDEWERISWDEALDEIAEKWNGYVKEFGPTSVGLFTGSGNYGLVNGMSVGGVTSRFLTASGIAYLNQTVDAAANFAMSRLLGMGYYSTGNEPADMMNAKTILIWGANPAISQIQNMHFLMEARDNGTKLIAIDPMFSQTAARSDEWVPVKPGTDGALAFGMMNYIVEQGWQDLDFLREHSVAACLVKEADGKFLRQADLDGSQPSADDAKNAATSLVMGKDGTPGIVGEVADPELEGSYEVEGIKVSTAYQLLLDRIAEYPVSKAAEITGVSEDLIKDVAEQYARNTPSRIYTFFGIDHYWNGHWSQGCLATLAVITGNVGKAGAFCGFQECLGSGLGNAVIASREGAPGQAAKYTAPFVTTALEEGEYDGQPFYIKMVMFSHTNAVTNMADRNDTLSWMNRCEFLVGADMLMTDTMRYCDIVLPVAHWFEKEDVFMSYATHPFALLQEKAIEPAFESRADIDIFNDLADRIGCGDLFKIATEEYLEQVFQTKQAQAMGADLATLREKKAVRQAGKEGEAYVYGEGGVFATTSKLAELYVENPVGSNPYTEGWDLAKEHLAYWEPALQVGDESRREKYPIQLLSEHSRFRTHTQWFEADMLKEIDTEPFIKLSPADAAAYGIAEGDRVKAYNELGSVVLTAQINSGLPEGMATCPKGWEAGEFIEGSFTELFTKEGNPFCSNQAYFDCTVAIEKL